MTYAGIDVTCATGSQPSGCGITSDDHGIPRATHTPRCAAGETPYSSSVTPNSNRQEAQISNDAPVSGAVLGGSNKDGNPQLGQVVGSALKIISSSLVWDWRPILPPDDQRTRGYSPSKLDSYWDSRSSLLTHLSCKFRCSPSAHPTDKPSQTSCQS
jgi:hypothetical protein